MWRDRLVLAAPANAPQNFFFSRMGDYTDWDYAATDPGRAFNGNASVAGRIGDPIRALIPFGDDTMLIACDRTIWRMTGDPADGGTLDRIADGIGCYGPDAWCTDTSGIAYMLGTGGFYRVTASGASSNLSSIRVPELASIVEGSVNVSLCWDVERMGVWMFCGTKSYFYDVRVDGFFPMEFRDRSLYDALGGEPMLCGGVWNTATGPYRLFVANGSIYELDDTATSDDGLPIRSYCIIGPFEAAKHGTETKACAWEWSFLRDGEETGTFNVDVALATARDAGGVLNALSPVVEFPSGAFTFNYEEENGSQTVNFIEAEFEEVSYSGKRGIRLSGAWFGLLLTKSDGLLDNPSAEKRWSIDRIDLYLLPAGRKR